MVRIGIESRQFGEQEFSVLLCGACAAALLDSLELRYVEIGFPAAEFHT